MIITKINNGNYVKSISNTRYLREFENEWKETLGCLVNYYPYLTNEWFGMWLQHFSGKSDANILMFYRNDRLQMIVPMIREESKRKGIKVAICKFIGNVYSPINTIIVNDTVRENLSTAMDMFIEYFVKLHNNWDIIEFDALPSEESWVEAFNIAINRNIFRSRSYDCFGNWYSEKINGSSNDYLEKRSKNFRASIKKNYKKLQQCGKVVFRMVTGEGDCPDYFTLYNEVYSRSWKKEERVGRTFFPDMVKYAERNGWLRLGLLFLDGRPIGAGFAIVTGGRAYFEKIAYDERYKSLGAGSVCLYEMIRHVIDEDSVFTIDFLRGDDEYKKHWVDKRRVRKGIMVYNNNLKGRYLSFCDLSVLPAINGNKRIRKIKEAVIKRMR